jgi:hypothetical protein
VKRALLIFLAAVLSAAAGTALSESSPLPPLPPFPAPDAIAPGSLKGCNLAHDFVIYHGSWDREPTAKERAELREYTQATAPCIIFVWKARCAPLPLFPTGSTNAFCEIQADYARAHLNNRRDLENRSENYREYNSRAEEIDRIFKETTASFFASAQKPIDNYNERQRQELDAQDRQAAARREEELIGILRQLGTPKPPKPVTTQCMGGNGTIQCTTY